MKVRYSLSNDGIVRLPAGVKTVTDEATQALQETWLRRQRELGDWLPSGGWLVKPTGFVRTADPAVPR